MKANGGLSGETRNPAGVILLAVLAVMFSGAFRVWEYGRPLQWWGETSTPGTYKRNLLAKQEHDGPVIDPCIGIVSEDECNPAPREFLRMSLVYINQSFSSEELKYRKKPLCAHSRH